jgi:hypothetical protein
MPSQPRRFEPGPVPNFVFGIKVLASELSLLAAETLTRWEIRMLERRRRQEEALHRALEDGTVQALEGADEDGRMAARQAEFLASEADRLGEKMTARRQARIQDRLRRWGI